MRLTQLKAFLKLHSLVLHLKPAEQSSHSSWLLKSGCSYCLVYDCIINKRENNFHDIIPQYHSNNPVCFSNRVLSITHLRRFIYAELKAYYISCIIVYFYTYKHLHYPIASALYTPYHRRIMPIRTHSRLVFDFHNYLIYLFLCTRISIFP